MSTLILGFQKRVDLICAQNASGTQAPKREKEKRKKKKKGKLSESREVLETEPASTVC